MKEQYLFIYFENASSSSEVTVSILKCYVQNHKSNEQLIENHYFLFPLTYRHWGSVDSTKNKRNDAFY